jgi:1-acyl-sn-glycerol-3-phosphate acyltransferase
MPFGVLVSLAIACRCPCATASSPSGERLHGPLPLRPRDSLPGDRPREHSRRTVGGLAKHQSAWETVGLQEIFPPLVFVLKKELLRVPFFGWGLAALKMISIDRAAAKDALKQVFDQGRDRLSAGYWVVIFPEGTRVAPGQTCRYKPGGAHLAVARAPASYRSRTTPANWATRRLRISSPD